MKRVISATCWAFCLFLLFSATAAAQPGGGRHLIPSHSDVAPALEKIDSVVGNGPFASKWSSLEHYEIPQWYKDAKLGIFIHWGVYSVPAYASEWYPRMMYIPQERRGKNVFQYHVKHYGPQSEFGYKDFIPKF